MLIYYLIYESRFNFKIFHDKMKYNKSIILIINEIIVFINK